MSTSKPDPSTPINEQQQNENVENNDIFTFSSGPRTISSVPFAKRSVKTTPQPKQSELRDRRRSAFLRKVRDGRDEGRFESRGEDIMRMEFVRRQKAWEAELAEQAPIESGEAEEEDEGWRRWDTDLPESGMQMSAPSTQQPWADDEVDEVLMREDRELDALIENLPDASQVHREEGVDEMGEVNLWSDDDDYDALFSEFMEKDDGTNQQQQQGPPLPTTATQMSGEEMDMS